MTRPRDAAGRDDEAELVADALDVPRDALTPLSREPLGDGTVAGFVLADGTVAYVDSSGLRVAAETGLVQEGVGRVWIHPADPHLPALAPAAFGDAASILLSRLGIPGAQMPGLVGYRPGRRAVLRVVTDEGVVWVKVVRPRRIERIVEAHRVLHAHGLPVPAVRGWSPGGLLVLDDAEGEPATETTWEPGGLIDAVGALRARLAAAPLEGPARTSLRERLPWYTAGLHALRPGRRDQIDDIAAAVSAIPESTDRVTIHGDLHLGQLFVRDGEVSGLIDVDTAGQGSADDDAAAFLAHAVASALLTEATGGTSSARVWALADAADRAWGGSSGARALTAVQLLGHAVGAASGGDERRADALLDYAARAVQERKSPLITGFEEA
ncbi:phosphotransferase [Microbacterium sp.]|uniref:phosphotransferase n=1 Tax=Microbacterium sp. TaxID=51671 RepID=UPI0039E55118